MSMFSFILGLFRERTCRRRDGNMALVAFPAPEQKMVVGGKTSVRGEGH